MYDERIREFLPEPYDGEEGETFTWDLTETEDVGKIIRMTVKNSPHAPEGQPDFIGIWPLDDVLYRHENDTMVSSIVRKMCHQLLVSYYLQIGDEDMARSLKQIIVG